MALAVKSAQIGYSTATASWAIISCLVVPNRLVIFVSRSAPQAKELALKAKMLIREMGGIEAALDTRFFRETQMLEHIIRFSNGSRIIALSSNPETARGYTGDIVLDEFGFHKQSEEIFRAAYRQITLGGYRMRILSTPNGQQGKFFELAKKNGLADAVEPDWLKAQRMQSENPPKVKGWSPHWCNIYLAAEQGFPVNPEQVREGCDELTWRQEYLCEFLSSDYLWITPDLIERAVSDECFMGEPVTSGGALYAGWDVARTRDLSVIWFVEVAGEMRNTVGVVELTGMPFPEQVAYARSWMPKLERLAIDATPGSIGQPIAEQLQKEFPGKVDPVEFSLGLKSKLAVLIRSYMEKGALKIPDSVVVRRSFGSIRRTYTSTGQPRFDAEHDAISHHGDHFWAACLALSAAEKPKIGLFDFYRKEAEMAQEQMPVTPPPVSPVDRAQWTRQQFERILRRR